KKMDESDLDGVLTLQRANHRDNVDSPDGFVTVVHTRDTLAKMNALLRSIVARDDIVVGYALSMARECRSLLPILGPMFDVLDTLALGRFYVMGLICGAAAH